MAVAALSAGDLAALPTETVYGLGGIAAFPGAIERIYQVKGRPANHPVIVHVPDSTSLEFWASSVPATARTLVKVFWPGPLTIVVPKAHGVSDALTASQPTVALRSSSHPLFQEVLRGLVDALGPSVGIAAPSANRFGRVSPTTATGVLDELGQWLTPGVDVILDGGRCDVGVESTIVICGESSVRIARSGGITAEQLGQYVVMDQAGGEEIRVPGGLPAHYRPSAHVVLADRTSLLSIIAIPETTGLIAPADTPTPQDWRRLMAPETAEAYAHDLYAALREADRLGLTTVVAVLPPALGIGIAIRDRLERASRA